MNSQRMRYGVPHIPWPEKPDYLQSRAEWSRRGWIPRFGARIIAWTNYKQAYIKLYHLRDCRTLASKKAEMRRIEYGLTRAEVSKMDLPLQLSMLLK